MARGLELPPSTVSSWKSGVGIPKWRMQGIRMLAEEHGIDLDRLAARSREAVHSPADTVTPAPTSPGKGEDLTASQQNEAA